MATTHLVTLVGAADTKRGEDRRPATKTGPRRTHPGMKPPADNETRHEHNAPGQENSHPATQPGPEHNAPVPVLPRPRYKAIHNAGDGLSNPQPPSQKDHSGLTRRLRRCNPQRAGAGADRSPLPGATTSGWVAEHGQTSEGRGRAGPRSLSLRMAIGGPPSSPLPRRFAMAHRLGRPGRSRAWLERWARLDSDPPMGLVRLRRGIGGGLDQGAFRRARFRCPGGGFAVLRTGSPGASVASPAGGSAVLRPVLPGPVSLQPAILGGDWALLSQRRCFLCSARAQLHQP